ncbi:hypothetical protein GCM10009677_57380 [Sphaerisporangium rubeum]|uniref:Uncharacterized protein n=1 Tax=Sphaerisporangium rubeum TaxID=321317 RepID=A0A7X0IFL3_9ACTN|nr:hypothetical protein [Sphaerisporangium rubeum]
MAHCSANLALLHGPVWGLRFAEAYQEAGGLLAATASERLYWQVREGPAFSEDSRARTGGSRSVDSRACRFRICHFLRRMR